MIPHFAVCYSLNKRWGSAGALLKANSENYTLSWWPHVSWLRLYIHDDTKPIWDLRLICPSAAMTQTSEKISVLKFCQLSLGCKIDVTPTMASCQFGCWFPVFIFPVWHHTPCWACCSSRSLTSETLNGNQLFEQRWHMLLFSILSHIPIYCRKFPPAACCCSLNSRKEDPCCHCDDKLQ